MSAQPETFVETPKEAAKRLFAGKVRQGYRPEALHEYRNAQGAPLLWRARLRNPDGDKHIRPFHLSADGYRLGEPQFDGLKPLYRLPDLQADGPVFVTEGESCADALARLGIVATTSGSSSSAAGADWSPLKGRDVVIWPDADEPGARYAEAVLDKLREAGAASIRVVDVRPLNLDEGGDVVDWLAAHADATAADVLALATVEPQGGGFSPRLRAVALGEFLDLDIPPRRQLMAPWLPEQGLAMVYAPRGVGKTHVSLSVAYAVASGGELFERWSAPAPAGVLFLDGEMPASALQERLAQIVASSEREATAPLRIVTPDLQPQGMPDISSVEGQAAINELIDDSIKLIVIDNLSTLVRSGRENEAESWTPVQGWALSQRAQGRSVLFIHHAGKGGQQRGTSRREDVLDTVISLRRPADYTPEQGAIFEVRFEKARGLHGNDAEPFEARLQSTPDGGMNWATRSLEASTFDRVVALANDGLKQAEIAMELGINRSTASRHYNKARGQGLIKGKP